MTARAPGLGECDQHKSYLQQKIGSVFTVTPSPCPPHGSVRLFIIYLFSIIFTFLILDAGMELLEKVNWDEVKETAKFYYSDSTTTLNLYPALGITFLILICK